MSTVYSPILPAYCWKLLTIFSLKQTELLVPSILSFLPHYIQQKEVSCHFWHSVCIYL
jgi:hypothetical protein